MKVCLPSGIYFYLLKNVQNIFETIKHIYEGKKIKFNQIIFQTTSTQFFFFKNVNYPCHTLSYIIIYLPKENLK